MPFHLYVCLCVCVTNDEDVLRFIPLTALSWSLLVCDVVRCNWCRVNESLLFTPPRAVLVAVVVVCSASGRQHFSRFVSTRGTRCDWSSPNAGHPKQLVDHLHEQRFPCRTLVLSLGLSFSHNIYICIHNCFLLCMYARPTCWRFTWF